MTGKKEKKNGGGHSVDEEAGNVRRAMIWLGRRWRVMIKAWWLKLKTEDGTLTIERRDTKVILTVWRTLPLHYTAVRRAPVPLRRFSPSEEHHSTPGLAFLHTGTNLNTQTKKKQIKRQWRVCWFDFFSNIQYKRFHLKPKKANQSLEVSRTLKGSIRSETKFTLTRTRDQFRVAQSVRFERKQSLILALRQRVRQTAGQNWRE